MTNQNLKLCLKHKQEKNQSHFAEHNCDYCKLEKVKIGKVYNNFISTEISGIQMVTMLNKNFEIDKQTEVVIYYDEEAKPCLLMTINQHGEKWTITKNELLIDNFENISKLSLEIAKRLKEND